MRTRTYLTAIAVCSIAAIGLSTLGGYAMGQSGQSAMFGNTPSRNMVSDETGLPAEWDVASGMNVKWSQPVGSQAYAGPTVFEGQVYVGTNNEGLRDPSQEGDRGVVMTFDAASGEFLWQVTHTKLPAGRVNDWPLQGVCSTPFVADGRVYYVSNQAHVTALDTAGDLIWSFDMINEVDAFPHNLATSSPLVVGDIVFASTGNGVDEGHITIPSPFGASFVALDKNTGELLWDSALPGEAILHGTWTNPAYGVIDGRPQVIFPGGDGWLYSFVPETGELIWKFDLNPKDAVWALGGRGTRNNVLSTPVIYDGKVFLGVGQDPEHGEAPGNFWVIDASGTGDVTATNAVWHLGGDEINRTMSTVAIADGIVYIADLSGFLYAHDVETGERLWTYDAFAAVWGSPFVADGKVYLGDEDGDVVILQHGRELVELGEFNMGAAVYTTPVAHDGVLYILSRNRLFALEAGGPLP
jgi:outer membrane protein assembly factor BamB